MNAWLLSALADSHGQELRGEAVGRQAREIRCYSAPSRIGPAGTRARPARGTGRGPRVRHRVGFALVEAGLHLLATAPRG
jgi:hypothetical protein